MILQTWKEEDIGSSQALFLVAPFFVVRRPSFRASEV